MPESLRLGLVLTGGGTRAAYQVGALRALAQLSVDVVAISAVGSGALNGAILAGYASISEAVDHMATLWAQTVLSPESALHFGPIPVLKLGTYLTLLFGGGVTPKIAEWVQSGMQTAREFHATRRTQHRSTGSAQMWMEVLSGFVDMIQISTDPVLESYLAGTLSVAVAHPLRPFFVSVYETDEGLLETFKLGLQGMGIIDCAPVFREVSAASLSAEERLRFVLASATLPFLCDATSVGGQSYIDGSFGGIKHSLGSVPLLPLRNRGDYDAILVVHTESGATWDANDFPGVPIIELLPEAGSDAGLGYFWADTAALRRWMATGERDATRVLSSFLEQKSDWSRAQAVREHLRHETEWLNDEE